MPQKYGGYMGKVVIYDLSAQTAAEYPWTDEDRRLYIGGKIMAAKILCDNFTGNEKAFSKENLIVISTGPLTGTGAPSSSRFNMSTLSPQTGFIASSNCGGRFGYYLKKAGIDALILKGQCEKPSWLEIDNGNFILHDASDIWGLKTGAAQEALKGKICEKKKRDVKTGQIVIGPAGENLVKYAAVISDERVAGRAGVGAVFGWKNLKGITAFGVKSAPVSDPAKTKEWCRKWFKYLRNHPLTGTQLPKLGTAALVSQMQSIGILSTKNYTYGKFDDYDKISGETLAKDYNIVNKGCLSCPIKCARTVKVDGKCVKGPELETLGLLGAGILNNDLEAVFRWNYELDELGLDTISAASTVAWAMEANEKGLWDNGLSFGRKDNISQTFEDIALRRGIGNELAEGTRILADKYGGKDFAINSKGLELAAYEPRRAVGQGLGYAVSNRGGCHLNGGYLVILEGLGLHTDPQTPKAKADFTMLFQDLLEMISATGQCLFTSYAFFPAFLIKKPHGVCAGICNMAIPHIGWAIRLINKHPGLACIHLPVFHHTKMMGYAVGMPMKFGEYLRTGERGYNLERYVNSKFGVSAEDDALPKRLTDVPQDSSQPDTKVPLEVMKKSYYKARGWDENGIPTEKTLKKLGII